MLLVGGSTIIVADANCILEPTEAKAMALHGGTARGAAEQARRKSQTLLDHRSPLRAGTRKRGSHLEANFNVAPLVVLSTTTDVGVAVNGVPVIDEYIIDPYLNGEQDGVAIFGADLAIQKTRKTEFFSTAEEAQARAANYFNAPPQLQRFHNGLKGHLTPLNAVEEQDWRGAVHTLGRIRASALWPQSLTSTFKGLYGRSVWLALSATGLLSAAAEFERWSSAFQAC